MERWRMAGAVDDGRMGSERRNRMDGLIPMLVRSLVSMKKRQYHRLPEGSLGGDRPAGRGAAWEEGVGGFGGGETFRQPRSRSDDPPELEARRLPSRSVSDGLLYRRSSAF